MTTNGQTGILQAVEKKFRGITGSTVITSFLKEVCSS